MQAARTFRIQEQLRGERWFYWVTGSIRFEDVEMRGAFKAAGWQWMPGSKAWQWAQRRNLDATVEDVQDAVRFLLAHGFVHYGTLLVAERHARLFDLPLPLPFAGSQPVVDGHRADEGAELRARCTFTPATTDAPGQVISLGESTSKTIARIRADQAHREVVA